MFCTCSPVFVPVIPTIGWSVGRRLDLALRWEICGNLTRLCFFLIYSACSCFSSKFRILTMCSYALSTSIVFAKNWLKFAFSGVAWSQGVGILFSVFDNVGTPLFGVPSSTLLPSCSAMAWGINYLRCAALPCR